MAAKKKEKYINFPIQLLEGFLTESKDSLKSIFQYGVYCYATDISVQKFGDISFDEDVYDEALKFFNIQSIKNDIKETWFNIGDHLYSELHANSPKVGINLSVLWDFNNGYKSEYEKVCLLGFLAIKSILQNKPYCKITNNYWLSRMDGKTHSVKEKSELSESIRKYANEYQTKKIKMELVHNWSLITYSRYTRGFYVSFKLSLEDLIFQAEKRRKSTKDKQHRLAQKNAYKNAMAKINQELG